MHKQIGASTHTQKYYAAEKGETINADNTDKPKVHFTKIKKPDSKAYILPDSTHMTLRKRQTIGMEYI